MKVHLVGYLVMLITWAWVVAAHEIEPSLRLAGVFFIMGLGLMTSPRR